MVNPRSKASTKRAATSTTSSGLKVKGSGDDPLSKGKKAPFSHLFRYSTRFELFLDFIGLICAIAAGAGLPLFALFFGNLTLGFVDFARAINNINNNQQPSTPGALLTFEIARDRLQEVTANNLLWLFLIGTGMFVTTYTYMLTWTYTGEVNSKRFREEYLRAVLRQEIAYLDSLEAGAATTCIQTDTHLLQQGISEKIALTANYLSVFFTSFILSFARAWKLSLAISSILPCMVIIGSIMENFASKYTQLALKHDTEGSILAEDVVSTIRVAQAFGAQERLSKFYDTRSQQVQRSGLKAAVANGIGIGVAFFIIYASYALATHFGATLILQGRADAGIVVSTALIVLTGTFSLTLLAPEFTAISHARAAAARLFVTIDRIPKIDSYSEEGARPNRLIGKITLENVDFQYPSRPDVPVLKNFSITFEAGKTSALIGASGSGKSTIVSLVERFYDPMAGSVKLDEVDLKDLNVRWLRDQIGLVSQEPSLFATTIKQNVAYGLVKTQRENTSEDEKFQLIKEACIKANADDFIQKFPDGYETVVGDHGHLLSAGQKQRIAIARAIVSNPRILLLDEATSALDTRSEGAVQDALRKAAAGRTTITIAHRLSTTKHADQIYVIGSGTVLEHGTHNELLANRNGPYSHFVNVQRLRNHQQVEDVYDAPCDGNGLAATLVPASPQADMSTKVAIREVLDVVPLNWTLTRSESFSSKVISQKRATRAGHYSQRSNKEHHIPYLFKRIRDINKADLNLYVSGGVLSFMLGLAQPVFGIFYSKAIESFSLPDPKQLRLQGDKNALWLLVIGVLCMIVGALQHYFLSVAAAKLSRTLKNICFKALLRQDIGWFDEEKNSAVALVSIVRNHPGKISSVADRPLGSMVQSIATIVGGAVIGLVIGPKLAAVGLACAPLSLGTGYIRLCVLVLKDQTNKAAHEESAQIACEAVGSVRTVQALTREHDCIYEYSRSLEEPLKMSNRSSVRSMFLLAISQAIPFFVVALVFWYGSKLVGRQEYSLFQFFVCLMSVTLGNFQVASTFEPASDISSARGAANDVINLLDNTPEIGTEAPDSTFCDKSISKGEIRFEDIHFRYPTRPGVRVLRNLNFVVEPGTHVAIVGESGSGKTTIFQLIERFYDPLAGRVLFDGVDIASLNVQHYRQNISLVFQEPTLYSGTIRFNILLGAAKPAEEITQEELENACRDANILDFINSLPEGFDTEVGNKGAQLSGGQKQRIAIARALLRDPRVLLLDEATSALDTFAEKVVQDALNNAAIGRTTITIAHRLSTIQDADKILCVEGGKIVEVGTHDELLSLKGRYYKLFLLQALSTPQGS